MQSIHYLKTYVWVWFDQIWLTGCISKILLNPDVVHRSKWHHLFPSKPCPHQTSEKSTDKTAKRKVWWNTTKPSSNIVCLCRMLCKKLTEKVRAFHINNCPYDLMCSVKRPMEIPANCAWTQFSLFRLLHLTVILPDCLVCAGRRSLGC